MTLLKPTIMVSRLIVFQSGHRAFDCPFHPGVNVLRGRNSSGKTTILDLLAFSLGAENIRWKPEALQCTDTMVEVLLNGEYACLRREISVEVQRPMSIFWGSFDEAFKAGAHLWERYPFKRSQHQTSFSQTLFGSLEMPQAQGDGASNLTMHQILRVLYADQPSVHSPIFRIDAFDSSLTREMIGGYLAGVYDDELYSAQLRTREVNILLNKQISELKGIFHVLGRSGQTPDLVFTNERILEMEDKREQLTHTMVQLKEDRVLPRKDANKARTKAENLRLQLNEARRDDFLLKNELAELELDIGDSLLFVQEIELRLQNLEESAETRSYFGNMLFRFCPNCLGELSDTRTDEKHCHLCTTELGSKRGESQLLRMRNELSIQLKESKSLIDSRIQKVEELKRNIPSLTEKIKQLERE
jgi:hypothetical protein